MSDIAGAIFPDSRQYKPGNGMLLGSTQPGTQSSATGKHIHPFQGQDFNPNPDFGTHVGYGSFLNNMPFIGYDSAGKSLIVQTLGNYSLLPDNLGLSTLYDPLEAFLQSFPDSEENMTSHENRPSLPDHSVQPWSSFSQSPALFTPFNVNQHPLSPMLLEHWLRTVPINLSFQRR